MHPHTIIDRIYGSGVAPHRYALDGQKKQVKSMPEVALIHDKLRRFRGTYWGQVATELVIDTA